MDVNATNHWQHLANNSHSNGKGQVNHGVQSNQTIVFSQNVAFPRSSVRSYQHPEHNSSSYNTKREDYKKQPATAGAYQCQMQNNQGQTFAEQTQLNQQAGCNVNQQVIQYNINVGNLPEPQTHVNQLVALQKQPSHEHPNLTPMQLQQSGMLKGQHPSSAYNPKLMPQNTQQYVVRRTLVDVQLGSLSTKQYFRSNSAELSLENHLNQNQHMNPVAYKSNAQVHAETDKYLNLPSTTPEPFVNVAKGQTTANHKEQRQRSSPPNQQYGHFSSAISTQYQQTPNQHAAIPTQSQQIPFEVQLQSLNQRRTRELANLENQMQCTQQSQQTERVSPQQTQQLSPQNQRKSPQIQQLSHQAPNPPQSSPQLQQPSLGEKLIRVVTSEGDVPSTAPSNELTLDDLLLEVKSLSKTRRKMEDKSQHQQTTTNRLSPFNQKKTPNNENCDDIQIVNCFSLQGKVDSIRGNHSTPQESITMKARNIKRGQLQAPVSKTGDSVAKTVRNNKQWPPHSRVVEPQDADDATFLLSCSKTAQRKPIHHDWVLPQIVGRFLGKDVSDVRSRDYVMYALSDDPRVAEAAIAAHLHESTKMFVCVEFPPRSPWSGGAREAKKSYFLVKNAGDVSRIVAYFPCTSVRMVLVISRLSQHVERRVQQTRQVPIVDLATSATKERKSPILAQLLQNSSVSQPAKQTINSSVVSSTEMHLTRRSNFNQKQKSPTLEEVGDQGLKVKVSISETPPVRPSHVEHQLNNSIQEKTSDQPSQPSPVNQTTQEKAAEQSEDQAHLSSPVNQSAPPSCSIESEEEKMTRIRKEVEALLNAGKPDLRKVMTKRSRGDSELPTLNRFWRKRKSRGIDVDSRSALSDVIIIDESSLNAKLQDCVDKHFPLFSETGKSKTSSATNNDDVISERDDATTDNVFVKLERVDLDYDQHLVTKTNWPDVIPDQDDVRADLVDVRFEHDDVISENDDVISEHDDVKAVLDDETVTSAIPTCPDLVGLNYGKAAKRNDDSELRKRKRASMRAGSCRAPRLDLVYRSYLDSLQPSPIVPRQCAPRDVTINSCSVRISDIFSLNNVA